MFNHRTSIQFGNYLFATHHAVWLNRQNALIDLTPFHHNPLHHPITKNNNVLFLLDDNAEPLKKGEYIIPLPLKFFAINNTLLLQNYVKELKKKNSIFTKRLMGFPVTY